MKKIFLILSVFFLASLFLSAQVSVDPRDEFYSDILCWKLKGYVDQLPKLKPYPVNVIEDILTEVIEKGEKAEKQRAEDYYNKIFGKKWHAVADNDYNVKIYKLGDVDNEHAKNFDHTHIITSELSLGGDLGFGKYIGTGYRLGVRGIYNKYEISDVLPKYVSNSDYDVTKIFNFNAGSADVNVDLAANVTMGTSTLYGVVGYNRLGYGIYPDTDIALNPNSNPLLFGSMNYEGKYFQYEQLLGVTAARAVDYDKSDFDFGKKFVGFHSLNVPVGNFDVSLFESVVFGNTFSPSYLIPVPWFIISNVDGGSANVISGMKVEYNPVPCIAVNASVFMDEFELKPFIKLKWNDANVHTAFKAGFAYSPLDSICQLITCDFTLVTPYTYTSYDTSSDKYNYTDYTNFGKGIGSELIPNSDRVSLSLKFKPFKHFTVTGSTAYVRHGNQYEDLSDEDVLLLSGETATDGSLYQNNQNLDSATDGTNFLSQDHKMYIMQASLDFEYDFVMKKTHEVAVTFGYTFEYIENDGVDSPIYAGTFTTVEAVQAARKNWEEALHNSYNHYFNVGVKISY